VSGEDPTRWAEHEAHPHFDELLVDLSSRLVEAPPEELDDEIESALVRLSECVGLDEATLWRCHGRSCQNLRLVRIHRADGTSVDPRPLIPADPLPWCRERLRAGDAVGVSCLADLPPEAEADRALWQRLGARSFAMLPLCSRGAPLLGALSFHARGEERNWPAAIMRRLQLSALIIAGALRRQEAEAGRRDSEDRLDLAAAAAGVGIWALDTANGVFWASPKARELFSYLPDEVITMGRFLESVVPGDRERVDEAVREAVKSAGGVDARYQISLPDGRRRWIQSRGRFQAAVAGKPAHLLGVSVDVTDLTHAMEVHADQLRFETLLADLSAHFVRLTGEEVEQEVERAVGQIARFFGCDRCGLLEVHEDRRHVRVAYAWYAKGLERVPEDLNLANVFPWSYERLVLGGEPVAVESTQGLPDAAERDRQTWEAMGVKSSLTVPLATGKQISWLLAINSLRAVHAWEPALIPRLALLGEVLVNALERRRADRQVRASLAEIEHLKRQLELENRYLRQESESRQGRGRIVGESPAILRVLALAEQVAPTKTTVLIEGETGTGKELIAGRIHELSPRRERAMIKVNCAALPSTLVESELFGRERGAYTGAVAREPGRFEGADGSTLFLDEIAELPFELQAKLLRVLEEGCFERVGSPRTLRADVRVIAATNRDLLAEVEAGRFRRDLYFRLSVFPIRVPPLRERREDVPLLVWSAVESFASAMQKSIESIPRQDMEGLKRYDWPGNVRELRNIVERAIILCSGPVLRLAPPVTRAPERSATMSLDEAQRRQIARALEAAEGRLSGPGGAAEKLGIKPTTLRSRMTRLGLDPRRRPGRHPTA